MPPTLRSDSSGGKIAGAILRLVLALLLAMFVRVAAAQAPVAALPLGQWTKFIDPNEGSFLMDVPAGWRISGGLARRNALQMWPWISAVSPDGNTVLAFGDPTLQSYTLPNSYAGDGRLPRG
jgi:hypothetical protein